MLIRSLSNFIRKLLPDQRGNVALIVAAAFPLLIGAAGLAVDGVEWVLQKRQIQAATDSAAMAGVYSLIAEQDMKTTVSDNLADPGLFQQMRACRPTSRRLAMKAIPSRWQSKWPCRRI